ncbi:MAG TPA: hypothetical protein VEL74_22130 [Thermoanaerobaculia bacterium]|nr:hypothetical protein [Thermoanaerobaculia bacterium]
MRNSVGRSLPWRCMALAVALWSAGAQAAQAQGADKVLLQVQAFHEEMRGSVAALARKVNDLKVELQSTRTAMEGRLDGLRSPVTSIQSSLTSLGAALGELARETAAVKALLDQPDEGALALLAGLRTGVAGVEGRVGAVATAVESNRSALADVGSRVAAVEESVQLPAGSDGPLGVFLAGWKEESTTSLDGLRSSSASVGALVLDETQGWQDLRRRVTALETTSAGIQRELEEQARRQVEHLDRILSGLERIEGGVASGEARIVEFSADAGERGGAPGLEMMVEADAVAAAGERATIEVLVFHGDGRRFVYDGQEGYGDEAGNLMVRESPGAPPDGRVRADLFLPFRVFGDTRPERLELRARLRRADGTVLAGRALLWREMPAASGR